MTFADLQKVEEFVGEFCHDHSMPKLPAMLSSTYDRVDIDLSQCLVDADVIQDWLSRRAVRLGYLWDFWFQDGEPHRTLCVSERGADE